MAIYILKRLVSTIPVLLGIATLVFLLMRMLPGDPAEIMLAGSGASAVQIAELRTQLGLDEPLFAQYLKFLAGAIRGDIGRSIFSHQPVVAMLLDQFPSTLELAVASTFLSLLFGIPLGVLAALHRHSWVDTLCIGVSVVGVSMPIFWSSLLLILLFSVNLGWLPVTSQPGFKGLVLPAVVLGFSALPTIARLSRSSMLDVLKQEYITTARSKGLRERAIVLKHALLNALIPIVTITGLQFGFLLGGAVVTETVFARRGVGSLVVNAIFNKDFPVVQGGILMTGLIFTIVNLLVDVIYAAINPMIRQEFGNG